MPLLYCLDQIKTIILLLSTSLNKMFKKFIPKTKLNYKHFVLQADSENNYTTATTGKKKFGKKTFSILLHYRVVAIVTSMYEQLHMYMYISIYTQNSRLKNQDFYMFCQ
jgi:hypothetical protein